MVSAILLSSKKPAEAVAISLSVVRSEERYEVKFRKGHYKYDYEVLAPTGKIIEYSKNYVK